MINNLGVGATTALNTRLDEIAAEQAAAEAAAAEATAATSEYLSETDLDAIIAALEDAHKLNTSTLSFDYVTI